MRLIEQMGAAVLAVSCVMGIAHAETGGRSKPVKVFILAGQSNMQGAGIISAGKDGDLDYAAANEFKYLKDADGKWVEREDVWYFKNIFKGRHSSPMKKGNLTPTVGGSKIGPEVAFGHVMGDHYDEQVLLIKCAWGGIPLAGPFRPPSSGPLPGNEDAPWVGEKYRLVLSDIKACLDNIKTHFPEYKNQGYEIAGFFWHQGWNDGCNPVFAKEYEKNMVNFVSDMRKDLSVPDMPFIIATSGMGGAGTRVVAPQIAAGKKIDNCTTVDTTGFLKHKVGRQISHWSNSADAYCRVGDASAKAMIELLKSK